MPRYVATQQMAPCLLGDMVTSVYSNTLDMGMKLVRQKIGSHLRMALADHALLPTRGTGLPCHTPTTSDYQNVLDMIRSYKCSTATTREACKYASMRRRPCKTCSLVWGHSLQAISW